VPPVTPTIPNVAPAGICAPQFGELTSTPMLPGSYSVAALAIPTADCRRQQMPAATQARRLTMANVLPRHVWRKTWADRVVAVMARRAPWLLRGMARLGAATGSR
jgi:hypothetical protein